MRGIIYKATNTLNNKCYVGSTCLTLEQRKKAHRYNFRSKTLYFYKALSKYGFDKFIWTEEEVIECPEELMLETLDQREVFHILKNKSLYNQQGYNVRLGGLNFQHSESTKRKISQSNKGKKVASGKNHWTFGKARDEVTKQKIRASKLGTKASEDTKRKMSVAQTGIKKSWSIAARERKKHQVDLELIRSLREKGHTVEEISNVLGCSRAIIKSRISSLKSRGLIPQGRPVSVSESTREKQRLAKMGQRASDETKKKMSEAQIKRWYGGN